MTIFKRLPLLLLLFVLLTTALMHIQAQTTHAQVSIPAGSCGDTVSDDAQLFGNRISDVLNQAQTFNRSLQADTRVVTVNQSKLAGRNLKSYADYVQSQCPNWKSSNSVLLLLSQGQEPFLRLGSTFSGKMTAADFQQMTLSIRSEANSGNYAQATIDLLKQVQKKLSPDYTWLWVTLIIVIVLIAAIALAVVFARRRQAATAISSARSQATQIKQAVVDNVGPLHQRIEDLSTRIEVLAALMPAATAHQLRNLFENAKAKTSKVQEDLGNLLGNPATNPGTETLPAAQYSQMQRSYQEVYNEAQEPLYLVSAVEAAVQRLEQNPQEQINFQQLVAQGQQNIAGPGYPPQSTWSGR